MNLYRYETCRECGRKWNVPIDAKFYALRGYLCPHCATKRKRPRTITRKPERRQAL